MPAPINHLKSKLARGDMLRGLWVCLGSDTVTEIAGHAGFDWCLIDGEHGAYDPTLIRRQLMILAGTPAEAVVRVPVNEDWVLKQVLDLGAQSVMVPMINSGEEARKAVAACRYAPQGIRGIGGATTRASGFGAFDGYNSTANDQICLLLQVETRAGLDDIDAIAATDGVDCVFIGPSDLCADMGYRDDPAAPAVWDAITRAVGKIRAAGKAAGIICPKAHHAAMVDAGVTFLGLGHDTGTMAKALRALLSDA